MLSFKCALPNSRLNVQSKIADKYNQYCEKWILAQIKVNDLKYHCYELYSHELTMS